MEPTELIALMRRQREGLEQPIFDWITKIDPEFMAAFNRMTVQAFGFYGDGAPDHSALSPKIKEFIAIAILSAARDWERLPSHMGRLRKLGATDKEVLEVLQTTGTMTGGPAMRGGIEAWLRMGVESGADSG
jgi:alkylhydroperoxidase/carboxymuconolactone decarboxylase family protein YurZ